jgi:hypothetical protein
VDGTEVTRPAQGACPGPVPGLSLGAMPLRETLFRGALGGSGLRRGWAWHPRAVHETARLAGFFAAHGIWSVSDGAELVPLLGYEDAGGDRGLERFVAGDPAEGADAGQAALAANRRGATRAVLVVDAYLRLESGRTDALLLDAVEYGSSGRTLRMAVPYRPPSDPRGFAVHRPKFVEVAGVGQPDWEALSDAFFAGVDSHEQAAAVWNAHLDPSI